MYTPLEASSEQEWYYIRSAWHFLSLWVRLTFSQTYPPVEASSEKEWYYIRSAWHLVSLWVRSAWHFVSLLARLPCSQMYPPVEASGGQEWYEVRSGRPELRCTFCRVFPIGFLISDDKSSSSKVVPWCSNTSDWWWKDMCKLVWREHSPYNISLHCMQEYVIRQHRYKTANGP